LGTPEQLVDCYPLLPDMDSTDDTEDIYEILSNAFDETFEIKSFSTTKEQRKWFVEKTRESRVSNIVWTKISKRVPEAGQSYLVLSDMGIGLTPDVAFYNGKQSDGNHWWTLTDVSIDPRMIKYWSEINIPIDN